MLGIAGDEQHPQVRPQLPADFCQLPTVHPGKTDVADQQVDALGRVEDRHRRVGITSLDKGIAQITQYVADQQPYRRIVLDDQHGLAVLRVGGMFDVDWIVLGQVTAKTRQIQVHRGAFADFALNGDMAARLFAEAVDHR
ncbi:hypothetical protein D3C73_1258410 [compost metagenome]